MLDRKKQIVVGLVVSVIVAVAGLGFPGPATHAAAAQSGGNNSEWADSPRVVWQYHGEPLTVGSLQSGYMSMRSGIIVPEGDTLYYSADRLMAFELKTGTIRWSVTPARMAPLCVAGKYVLTSMSDRTLNALSSTNGGTLWSTGVPDGDFYWLRANATTVLACLEMGRENQVCAFDLKTGKLLWQSSGSTVTPQSDNDCVTYLVGPKGKTAIAADERTGRPVWTFEAPERLLDLSVGGPFILTESVNTLFVLDRASGRLKWKRAITGNTFVYPNEGSLIMTLDSGVLTALDPQNGRQVWEHKLPAQASNTAVISDKVYAATRNGVWAFDRSSGMALWKTEGASSMWPLRINRVENDVVYVLGDGLSALDAGSGGLLWKFNPGPELTRLVIVDGMAYLSDQDGSSLYVIRAGKD